MKRIALISLHTPTATNYCGASALPYHLLVFRPKDVEVEVWTYNLNGCDNKAIAKSEEELGIKIHLLECPKKLRFFQPAIVRLFLPKPLLSYLNLSPSSYAEISTFIENSQSAVWIYGEDISHLALKFEGKRIVITTPDCEAMYYHRVMAMEGVPQNKMLLARYVLMYHRYASMASNFPVGSNITYHLVGSEDARFLKKLNKEANVMFIRHPHYGAFVGHNNDNFEDGKIKLLIAGRYDFSMYQAADEAIHAMTSLSQEIKEKYHVTFLGKGWEKCCDILKGVGYDAVIKEYVENYAEEVSSHHIQITPVAVGTGTKGKVLDAFVNGLMVIGTPLAIENIAVENGKECVEYSNGDELAKWLVRLADEPTIISSIAKAGRAAVLREHGREKVAKEIFSLFE